LYCIVLYCIVLQSTVTSLGGSSVHSQFLSPSSFFFTRTYSRAVPLGVWGARCGKRQTWAPPCMDPSPRPKRHERKIGQPN